MRTEDGYIIRKCLNGEAEAFGLLVDKYKESIYALAYSKVRNFHDAEDITQEAFIKAFQKLRTLRWWDNFMAWMYAITTNLCKDWVRAQSRRTDRESVEDQDPQSLSRQSMYTYRRELAFESLHEALDSLPETYRQVLVLHYLGGMKTKAVKKGDRYILEGSKNWITYAQVADLGLIYAYTDASKRYEGMSCFIVDLHTEGVSTGPTAEKMGWQACPTGELFFDGVEVPEENLLGGKEGRGFEQVMSSLNNTRLTAAAGAVGVSQGLIDEAISYAKEREQFGRPVGKFQMVQEELARMIAETDAARLLVYRAAAQKDEGNLINVRETVTAKYYACDVASRVADGALRILGAYGYSREYPVERLLRDAKLYQILEGSANICKMIIATDALGYRQANR